MCSKKRSGDLGTILVLSGISWLLGYVSLCTDSDIFLMMGLGKTAPSIDYSKKCVIFLKVKNKGMLDSPFQIGKSSFMCTLYLVYCDSP